MTYVDRHPLRKSLETLNDRQLLLEAFGYTGPVSNLGELFGFHEAPANSVQECDQRRFLACAELMARALAARMRDPGDALQTPSAIRSYLQLKLGGRRVETFAVLWLDSQNRLIAYEELFRGTLCQTSVYPREVVKSAMQHNAAAVVLAHNHPSGSAQPSRADEALTHNLKAALALVDVRVMDHFIVTSDRAVSMAEMGLV